MQSSWRQSTRVFVLVFAMGTLAAACGGSGGATVTVTQPSPPAAAPAPAPAPPPPPPSTNGNGFEPAQPETEPRTLTCGWWLTHISDLPQTTTNAYAISTCSGETYGSSKPVVLDVYK